MKRASPAIRTDAAAMVADTFVPTSILDVDLDKPPAGLDRGGPARLILRQNGFPVGFVPIVVPPGGLEPANVRDAVAKALRSGEQHLLPAGGGVSASAPPNPSCSKARKRVSVVVTTCHASPDLLRTLESIEAQSVAPHEVIVVDNRPTTSGIAAMFGEEPRDDVRLVQAPQPGLSRARNAGWAAATGDVVAFTDDDVVADRRWVEALERAFVDPDVACVTGLVLPWELETRAQALFEQFGGFGKGFARRKFDLSANRHPHPLYPYTAGVFGTGANSAFRANLLKLVGGFDTHLGAGTPARGGEDLDIHLTLVQQGYLIVYEPAALIRHRHHADFEDLRRQVFSYGVGLSAMLTKRWLGSPAERRQMNAKLGRGLRYLLSPQSPKNAQKDERYPTVLTLSELAGIAYGPLAYLRSRISRSVP